MNNILPLLLKGILEAERLNDGLESTPSSSSDRAPPFWKRGFLFRTQCHSAVGKYSHNAFRRSHFHKEPPKEVYVNFTVAKLEGWNNETVLHENRSYFPENRKCIVFALQHGGNDVITWKCSMHSKTVPRQVIFAASDVWYFSKILFHSIGLPEATDLL